MSLLSIGEKDYQGLFRHSIRLGTLFKKLLRERGWGVLNETPLPVVCFLPTDQDWDKAAVENFVNKVNQTGKTWITSTEIGNQKKAVVRVGFPNLASEEKHVRELVDLLERERSET